MNDDIFRPEGADWVEPARPPAEPMVNVSATDGFAVDGTDAFAIDERPIPMPVEAPAPDPDDVPALSRGRLVATVGAALTGLLVVILVGSSTGPRPVVSEAGVLRTDDGVTTTTGPGGSTPVGAWTSLLGLWGSSAFAPVYEFDGSDELATEYYTTDPYGTTYPTEYETDFDSQFDTQYDSQFDTQFDTDFDDSSTFTYNTLPPRRLPVFSTPSRSRSVPPRPIPTAPPTTAPPTTAPPTTAPPTTAPPTTAPPTTAPPTTAAPIPLTWVAARSGLPVQCPAELRLWRRPNALVASVPNSGLFTLPDGASEWTKLGSEAGLAGHRVLVQDPATSKTFWVAGTAGVFRSEDDGAKFVALGDLTDVGALSVGLSTPGPDRLLAASGGALQLSVDDGETWTDLTAKLPAGFDANGHPLVLNDKTALFGTAGGVYRLLDGGQAWTPTLVDGRAVVGAPVRSSTGAIYWLLPDGGGLLVSADEGLTWTKVSDGGDKISPTATSLVVSTAGTLLTEGVGAVMVESSDGGKTWADAGPACPAPPTPG